MRIQEDFEDWWNKNNPHLTADGRYVTTSPSEFTALSSRYLLGDVLATSEDNDVVVFENLDGDIELYVLSEHFGQILDLDKNKLSDFVDFCCTMESFQIPFTPQDLLNVIEPAFRP